MSTSDFAMIALLVLTFFCMTGLHIERTEARIIEAINQKLAIDPCHEHYKLQSTGSRKYNRKPAYNRKQVKQVVSTCGDE